MVGSQKLQALSFVELNRGIRFPREKGSVSATAWGQAAAPWAEAKAFLSTQVCTAHTEKFTGERLD